LIKATAAVLARRFQSNTAIVGGERKGYTMTPNKLNRAFVLAGVTMPTVRTHIERTLATQAATLADLTSKQLAGVIKLANAAYHDGRSSTLASVVDDAVWIGGGVDKLLPLAALKAIDIAEHIEWSPGKPNGNWLQQKPTPWTIRTYSLNYTERT
jgi:hypothetical protein